MAGMTAAPLTIPAFLAEAVRRFAAEPALGYIRGGELRWFTWSEVAERAAALAAEIREVGVEPGDRVAHISENRWEWIITDLAMHLADAVHVPIHVTLSGQQIAEQINDCGARIVFVSNRELLAKFAQHMASGAKYLLHDEQGDFNLTLLGEPAVAPSSQPPAPPGVVIEYHPAPPKPPAEPGADRTSKVTEFLVAHTDSAALATILYTSGTTGRPRGVLLSQRNLASNAAALADAHGSSQDQTRLCILPLSHIYARTCDLYTWVYRGSRLVLAENRDTLTRDCQLAKPTALSAVPYVYQRIAERVRTAAPAPQHEEATLRAALGGNIQRLSCGGAPLAPHLDAWYAERGMRVLSGYGLTEAAPVVTTSTTACWRTGSVGRPLANIEVCITTDGEILVRGPNVMLGYEHDEQATAEAIRDGWLHTGDLGELDEDGFLYVRGRKKELIVLSTGKNVLPTRVESLLTASPLIEQAAVFGDGRASLVALIVPSACGLASGEERGARSEMIAEEIERSLKSAAHEEQVRHFAILDRPFSIERGELTAKLSLCRDTIRRNFAAEIEAAS
jgi:long-chain acyl-CoA synthetase